MSHGERSDHGICPNLRKTRRRIIFARHRKQCGNIQGENLPANIATAPTVRGDHLSFASWGYRTRQLQRQRGTPPQIDWNMFRGVDLFLTGPSAGRRQLAQQTIDPPPAMS